MLRPFDILKDAPNNSFNRSAYSAAFIRKVEGLIQCVRARLIRALGCSVESVAREWRWAVSEMTWASVENAPPRELFRGVRLRTLWQGENGAKAQVLEMDPGSCWVGVDVHEPGPEEVFVVSGVFNDGVRDYPAGSFIHAPAGSSHVPQSRTGCVLFVFYPEG